MIDYYERISTGGADDKVTLGKTKRDFDPNVDYTIYAVANCTEFSEADIQTQIKDQSLADLNDFFVSQQTIYMLREWKQVLLMFRKLL